jgi:glycosyltransferase involved in cell wall biosynthesis
MPSHYEGTPLSLLEAMMCNRPGVVTNVGGNRDLIINGVSGFLCPKPDVALFAASLEELWLAKNRLLDMGKQARAIALVHGAASAISNFLDVVIHNHRDRVSKTQHEY